MALPDLSSLPVWLQVFLYTIFGVSTIIAFLASRFGLLKGRSAPADTRRHATQISMATLDDTAIREATKAVSSLAASMNRLGDVAERYMADLNAQREKDEDTRIEERGYQRGLDEKAARHTPNPKRPPRAGQ